MTDIHPTSPGRSTRLPLHGLLIATIVGLIGRQLSVVALPWFVLSTTGSASKAGLVGFAVLLPGLIVGIFGGVLVDRFGYKRVSVAADTVCAVATFLIPLLYVTIGLSFWQLLVLVFFSSLLDVPALTARRSMIPELAHLAGMPVERVNAMFESLQNLSLLVGTPLAGLLVAWLGAENVLWLDAASSAVSAMVVLVAVPATIFATSGFQSRGYLSDILDGLVFIRRDRVLWPMVIVLALSNATSVSIAGVLLPVYVLDHFGSSASLGVMIAALGAGAFLGATVYGALAGRIPRRAIWAGAYLLMPVELWVFLLSPGVAMIIAAFLVAGFAAGPLNPLMVTIRHERSPAVLRGRVFSTYSAIAMAAQPVGILVAGTLVDGIGFSPTVMFLAVISQLVGVAALIIPAFRHLDAPLPGATSAATDGAAGS